MDTGLDIDAALGELRKLREGPGLSADRLSRCPNLLSALGTSDPGEAFDTLVAVLRQMGDGERARALRVDFGVDLEDLLGRRPTSEEQDFLGSRRSGYGEVIKRAAKTLSRWSETTTAELRGKLITDQFNGQIVVAAVVEDRYVRGIEVLRYERDDAKLSYGRNMGYPNPEESSLPLLIYGFPRDWRPTSIRFAVAFTGDRPTRVWALACDSVLDVTFGHERFAVPLADSLAQCRVDDPRRDRLYGVWWEW